MSKRKTRPKHYHADNAGGWNNRTQYGKRVRKSRTTIWRWDRAGLLPPPDGYDPFGNPMWRDATIDNGLAGNTQNGDAQ